MCNLVETQNVANNTYIADKTNKNVSITKIENANKTNTDNTFMNESEMLYRVFCLFYSV